MPRRLVGDEISIDTHDLQKLGLDLKVSDRVLARSLPKNLRLAAEPVRAGIAAEAAWSTRIPGALAVRTSFAGRRGASVKVIVDAKKAPEGRPLNNRDRQGTFRHPVHADPNRTRSEWTWVSQQARPFMARGAEAGFPLAVRQVANVYDDIAHAAGFRG